MSDNTLPQNLEDWPHDPFVLFGVTPAVLPRDLRRVYTALIRIYRPERQPDHFRRIREAYETLQQYAAWNETRNSEADGEQINPAVSATTRTDGPKDDPSASAIPQTAVDPQVQSWKWALAGDLQRAYQSLLELLDRQPQPAALYLRLYWLSVALPDLDPTRLPRDWLAKGLATCTPQGRLLEVYAEELLDDPREVLSQRFVELLEQSRGSCFLELLEHRWRALAGLERWDIAYEDLSRFGERAIRDDELGWLRMLLSLAGKCFRADRPGADAVFRNCQARIKRLGHLALAYGDLFDRAEMLSDLARESTLPLNRLVFNVVAHFVAGRLEEAATAAEPFLTVVCEKPGEGLRILDHTFSQAPHLFNQFGRALDWLSWDTPQKENREHSEDAAVWLVNRLIVQGTGDLPYAKSRWLILNFCCKEALPPEQLCRVLEVKKYVHRTLPEAAIAGDLPLRWTYLAFQLGLSRA